MSAAAALAPHLSRRRSARALALADAICLLIVQGGEAGELEAYQIPDPDRSGEFKTCRRPPLVWFERLLRAVEVGAFERLKPPEIVARILATPAPENEQYKLLARPT